jgi:transcriptional regulator with XRE-family HTH domain
MVEKMKMEEILKAIGQRIKRMRKEKNLTQQEVADYLNVKRPNLSRIETGEVTPTLKHILRLCELFQVSIQFLILGKQSTELPDFQEMNDKILEMLGHMAMNPSLMHAMLSHYYAKKFEFEKYESDKEIKDEETTGEEK